MPAVAGRGDDRHQLDGAAEGDLSDRVPGLMDRRAANVGRRANVGRGDDGDEIVDDHFAAR